MSQLSVLRQEPNLRFCDDAMLLTLSYKDSWQEQSSQGVFQGL